MILNASEFKRFLPLPFTVITTVDLKGVPNAAPYGCVMPVLRPLDLICIASALKRDTLSNIRETGDFIVNVVAPSSFKKAMMCAKSYPPEINELDAVDLTSEPARMVSPPRIKDSIGWIEAKLEEEIRRENFSLIIGRVLCSEINDKYCHEGGKLTESPLTILFPFFKKVGEKVGSREEFEELVGS